MPAPKCSEEDFIALFKAHGPEQTARILGVATRNVLGRRKAIEIRDGIRILAPQDHANTDIGHTRRANVTYSPRLTLDLREGIAIVGSDAHYWPDEITPAHRALLYLCRELQPKATILNGDIFDLPRAAKHSPIGWNKTPKVEEERQAVEERTTEIEDASKKAQHLWLMGNHDLRFENRLALQVPEMEGTPGFCLKDHFPRWDMGMSLWINDRVVVKHRFKGGLHATHNNTLWAGKTMVTGHLHSLKVTPLSDYNGIRYGVDTGTLSNPYGDHAAYGEDNPLNHRSGFIVLTFHKGELLWPEIAAVVDETHFQFRGKVYSV